MRGIRGPVRKIDDNFDGGHDMNSEKNNLPRQQRCFCKADFDSPA